MHWQSVSVILLVMVYGIHGGKKDEATLKDIKSNTDKIIAMLEDLKEEPGVNKSELYTNINTQDDRIYTGNINIDKSWAVMFEVKACNDAHLALSAVAGDTDHETYEVVLSGWINTQSVIRDRKQGPHKATANTTNLLNCKELRKFWITWKHGHIKVGKGHTIGADMFMDWQDPTPHPITTISVATGWGSSGTWKIHDMREQHYIAVWADDGYLIYVDGVRLGGNMNVGDVDIWPVNTTDIKVVAILGVNYIVHGGILVATSWGGWVTDDIHWKCINHFEHYWYSVGFNDRNWPVAKPAARDRAYYQGYFRALDFSHVDPRAVTIWTARANFMAFCRYTNNQIAEKYTCTGKEDWMLVGRRCFLRIENRVNFEQGHQRCQNLNADLASIHSDEENKQLLDTRYTSDEGYLIGLNDIQTNHVNEWADGSPVDFRPSTTLNRFLGQDTCYRIIYTGVWYKTSCSKKKGLLGYICSKPAIGTEE